MKLFYYVRRQILVIPDMTLCRKICQTTIQFTSYYAKIYEHIRPRLTNQPRFLNTVPEGFVSQFVSIM